MLVSSGDSTSREGPALPKLSALLQDGVNWAFSFSSILSLYTDLVSRDGVANGSSLRTLFSRSYVSECAAAGTTLLLVRPIVLRGVA
ncbi:MAG: hypothetical protein Q8P67_18250 [archaeon]|nr:hypothetical protein [archaeon]